MDGNTSGVNGNNVDWDTEDELDEIENFTLSSSSANLGSGEGSSSPRPSNTKVFGHFVSMGFSQKMVAKAIQEHGEEDADSILESLLLYSALENSTPEQDSPPEQSSPPEQCFPPQQQQIDSDPFSSDYEGSFLDGFSDLDSSDNEEISIPTSEEEKKLVALVKMGYPELEASIAIERCGVNSSLVDLTDFISAAQFSRAEDAHFPLEEKPRRLHIDDKKKRKLCEYAMSKRKKKVGLGNGIIEEDDEALHLPNPMIGFGTPTHLCQIHRSIPEAATGAPYFYYENVALTPKGVWNTISRFLYDIQPEFVDSKYFCAAARKRGYVHNLPIENRFPLIPLPPQTIFDAFPMTRRWWPSWDERKQLNCLQTCIASAKLTERIRLALKDYDEDEIPPERVRRYVLYECRKWNLVWVGKNKVAPLEPDEVETLLGFPRNHTRGISRTDRYKSLGNSFQIDTVAYHLSVLKDRFPNGINLLSLFSGIGGAEIALHRLGIRMKNVVSVEISAVSRTVVRTWWEQTNQKGNLYHLADVQELNADRLEHYINTFGGFDLVVGGSPCNNLAGSNRHHRDGLEGKESSLFYDYFRILDLVKGLMARHS
ncbi:putative DNA (cytosine-5-)-methyltransferase [Rosa chinensis]|uniref:DNA (cytosine-5-)-methyltransferase n=1 Tax=Rosa chinensis TaxID=74649 RepID=A0A2P6S5M2_ROSCH|nr:DNA (cytosine-5)-methyltransferase DRM2 isoform X1 [Rosa chinensis]PRQ53966.1 putative DNA (cytosine-5-)-methyltransferase [Rosa chinensis]